MSILWCGSEDVDMQSPYGVDDYQLYDSNFSRIGITSGKSTLFTSVTSCWVHASIRMYAGLEGRIGLVDNATGYGFIISKDRYHLYLIKHASSDTTLYTNNTDLGTSNKIDLQLINYGANATLNAYVDGNLIGTYTGDISIPNITGFNCLSFSVSSYTKFTEIIVADEDTRLMRLKTIAPSAAGDTNSWTGAYTDVDETSLSDSDKIYSATDNADFQCNLTGMPTGTWSVKAVKVAARCVDGSGSTGIQLGIKSGGTVNVGDTQTASGYWQTKERLMQVNPVTGVAFTPAEIEALQINLRAKAL